MWRARWPPQGAELRLLVRKTSNLANLEGIAGDTHAGDLARPGIAAAGAGRLRRRGARGRRLPAVDPRPLGPVPHQRGRHARAPAPGPRGRGRRGLSTPPAWRRCISTPTAGSPTRMRRSRSPTWSAITSAPSSWPSGRRSPPRRPASRSSSSIPAPPSGPMTPSPRPPAGSSWTFSTAGFPPTWTPASISWTWPKSPAPTPKPWSGASPAAATSSAAKT